MNYVLKILNRMDTRLSSIEKNIGKNTHTLKEMNDKLTSLTSRLITAETEITKVKNLNHVHRVLATYLMN